MAATRLSYEDNRYLYDRLAGFLVQVSQQPQSKQPITIRKVGFVRMANVFVCVREHVHHTCFTGSEVCQGPGRCHQD
jgi:hypothetical protein